MVSIDSSDQKVRYKREQIAKMINLSENQKAIIDLYILEENTGKRHWELDPQDNNIYMEWMTGVNILRNKVKLYQSLSAKQQKAEMYNSGMKGQQSYNGNFSEVKQVPIPPQQQPQQERIIRTSSGAEYKASERPDLVKLANKPKRYPRHSR